MKKIAVPVVALALAGVLSACGSDSSKASADPSSAATSASSAPEAEVPVAGDVADMRPVMEKMRAAMQAAGSVHTELSGIPEAEVEADIIFDETAPKMAMAMSTEGGAMIFRLVDGVVYMTMDDPASDAAQWLKTDTNAQADGGPSSFGSDVDTITGGSAAEFEGIKATAAPAAGGGVTYTMSLTQEELLAKIDAGGGAFMGLDKETAQEMTDGWTSEITIGSDGLPVSTMIPVPEGTVVSTYSKWGEPVTIEAPPASQVTDTSELTS